MAMFDGTTSQIIWQYEIEADGSQAVGMFYNAITDQFYASAYMDIGSSHSYFFMEKYTASTGTLLYKYAVDSATTFYSLYAISLNNIGTIFAACLHLGNA